MRLTSESVLRGEKNSFASYAYAGGVETTTRKDNENQQQTSSRVPDKAFMNQIKSLPVSKPVVNGNKRRIVLSDDDEDESKTLVPTEFVPKNKTSSGLSDDTWLVARDPSKLTEFERENNKKIAIAERKQSKQPRIQKVQKLERANDSEEEITDTPDKGRPKMSQILSKSNLIRSALNQSTTNDSEDEDDPVDQVRRFKQQEKQESRAKRVESRGNEKHKKSSSSKKSGPVDLTGGSDPEEVDDDGVDDDSSSGEDSEGNRWRDDIGKGELQEQANKILKNCDNVSVNLRKSIRAWHSGDENSSSGSAKDCVDLMTINEGKGDRASSDQVLHDEDVRVLCPGLQLKAYQLVGVNWMKLLHANMVNGVLADDMGLGKTVQTIAFLGWLKSSRGEGVGKRLRPHLIVVPASTLANWQNEMFRFCPSFRVVTYHGSQAERSKLRYELKTGISEGEVDVILSTYTIFERESGKSDRAFLYGQSFEYLILDEAHCIKNADSSRYTNLNGLKTKHRLLLSGTPVQNDLSELLAMLSFLMPNVFGRTNCELLIEAFGWTRSGNNNNSSSSAGSLSMIQLRGMLAPFVLRRLKRDVLDQLSDKISVLEKLAMTDFQRQVYDSVLLGHTVRKDRLKAQFDAKEQALSAIDGSSKVKKVSSSSSLTSGSVKDVPKPKKLTAAQKELMDLTSPVKEKAAPPPKEEVESDIATVDLEVLKEAAGVVVTEESASQLVNELSASEANHLFTALRKAANHPLLLRVRYKDEAVMERIAMVAYHQEHFGNQCNYERVREEVDKFSDYDLHLLCLDYPDSLGGLELSAEVLYDSPKMKRLREMLPQLQSEGHRMLVFSQWTRLLDLLEVLLYDMGMPFLRLDGSTPVKERQEMIDTYTHDATIPVFLLSTKAGGLGINLIAADTVIMHDLDFNPENDRQAEDRCHRIGQTKPVTVYKLVAADTVDEDIYEMGERKRKLSHAVLSDDREGKTSGTKKTAAAADGEDMNAIGKMLQRALARRAAVSAGPSSVAVAKVVNSAPLRVELGNVHLE